jgi:alpha-glucosidase
MLALPGAVFVYNGQELGLPNVDLPDEVLQDPVWERSGHTDRGRDGCRVPMPWQGTSPPFGFSTNPDTWLPMPSEWAGHTVESQLADPASTLHFFRELIRLRRRDFQYDGNAVEWMETGRDSAVLAFRSAGVVCVVNTGDTSAELDADLGRLIIASAPLVEGRLAPDSAAWFG